MGAEEDYTDTCRYTVTTRLSLHYRWAAMSAILIFHSSLGAEAQDGAHKSQVLKRKPGDPKHWLALPIDARFNDKISSLC